MPRLCKTCHHPERAAIDAALVQGTPATHVARTYGIPEDSVDRHARNHLPAELRERFAEKRAGEVDRLAALSDAMMDAALSLVTGRKVTPAAINAAARALEVRGRLEYQGRVSAPDGRFREPLSPELWGPLMDELEARGTWDD